MAHLRVDIETLQQLVGLLQYPSPNVASRLAPVLVWEGTPPSKYQQQYADLVQAERRLAEARKALAASISQIADNFREIDALGATAFQSAGSEAARTDPGLTTENFPNEAGDVSVEAYFSTDDVDAADRILVALDGLLVVLGYEGPTDVEVIRGSIWRRARTRLQQGISSDQIQSRLTKVERAIELAQVDRRQADVDATFSGAVSALLASLTETPHACIRVGSLLLIKYTDATGSVIVTRNLSQREIRTLEKFPEIQKRPADVLGALASAMSLAQIEEGL